jgi:hypothetical protein
MKNENKILEKNEVIEVIEEENEDIDELTPYEVEKYFKKKIIWHLFRIVFDLNNDGGLREYIQTAESVIKANINDICSGNYDFALDENLYLWSDTWELRGILLEIAIYCKELTLKEWQGEDPDKKLSTFFRDIINYFRRLPYFGQYLGDCITENENLICGIENDCYEYLYTRLWPFVHYLYSPPIDDKASFYIIDIDKEELK